MLRKFNNSDKSLDVLRRTPLQRPCTCTRESVCHSRRFNSVTFRTANSARSSRNICRKEVYCLLIVDAAVIDYNEIEGVENKVNGDNDCYDDA
ncbi:hypothetical protein DPMN_077213 [Dreissena polymorpha]|uniref:Uncharacterized protein n=1 Tax=Dreissena polymorpha TaxID=45954 RepID=A0A9D3YPJ7_DREPO|nr:hypothetical protein DPMN_077213 [Dreissena polymorpha]